LADIDAAVGLMCIQQIRLLVVLQRLATLLLNVVAVGQLVVQLAQALDLPELRTEVQERLVHVYGLAERLHLVVAVAHRP